MREICLIVLYLLLMYFLKPRYQIISEIIIIDTFMYFIRLSNDFLETVLITLLFLSSLTDLWFEEIYALNSYAIAIISLAMAITSKIELTSLIIGLALPIVLIIINKLYKPIIGDGDIEMLIFMTIIINQKIYFVFNLTYLLLGLYVLISYLFSKVKKQYPLLPFLNIAFCIIYFSSLIS